jgi:F-type H+-transporting ATPase subunit b
MAAPKTTDQPLTTGLYVPTAAPQGGSKFPPFDGSTFAPQLVWLAITFAALYFLMSRVALPRIGSVIEERRERIARDLTEAQRMKAETDAALKAYEQSLADARGKAQAVAKETRDRVAASLERDRQSADQANAAKVADMEKRIGESKARALASVSDIAAETAGALVGKLLGREVPLDEIRKAVASDSR